MRVSRREDIVDHHLVFIHCDGLREQEQVMMGERNKQ